MPNTSPPHTPCWHCPQPATHTVEWRTPDHRSATRDEHYGPYQLFTCTNHIADADTHADNAGADRVEVYAMTQAQLADLSDDRAVA